MKTFLILIPTLSKGGAEAMAYQYGKYLQKDNMMNIYVMNACELELINQY